MFDFIKENIGLWIVIFLLIVAPSLLFGALQVVGIIILVLILLALIGGAIFRWKLTNFAKQHQQQSGNGGNPFTGEQQQSNSRGWGRSGADPKVKVYKTEPTSATEKKVSDKVGDYVDFEEIKK